MTGSWYGGAFVGGMMGMLIISGLNSSARFHNSPATREVEQETSPDDDTKDAE